MGSRAEHGTLHPDQLPASFERVEPDRALAGLVQWWWLSTWDIPDGATSRQHVLAFPSCNLAVETELVGFAGPTTHASHRDLEGRGWVVGARLRPAAVPAFTGDPGACRDQYLTLDAPDLHRAVTALVDAEGPRAAIGVVEEWLVDRAGEPTEEALLANHMADACEQEPDITTITDLADACGVSVRTLHRLAARYVGLTPYAMIRRRRLQDAAYRLRDATRPSAALVAAEHGFSDQAHFTREFQKTLGCSPSDYLHQIHSRPRPLGPAS